MLLTLYCGRVVLWTRRFVDATVRDSARRAAVVDRGPINAAERQVRRAGCVQEVRPNYVVPGGGSYAVSEWAGGVGWHRL